MYSYDAIQNLLTLAIEATVVIGLGAIALKEAINFCKSNHLPIPSPNPAYKPSELLKLAVRELASEAGLKVDSPLESPDIPAPAGKEIDTPKTQAILADAPTSLSLRVTLRPASPIAPVEEPAEEVAPATVEPTPETAIAPQDLKALDPFALRKLCQQYGIKWRNALGKNKHLPKPAMVAQLSAKLA